jgi:C-terminal processing protease CtpA/Prc
MKTTMSLRICVLAWIASVLSSWGADVGSTGAWIVERKKEGEPMRTGMVFPKSPAEKAGIKPDWYLIAIDGTNVVKTPSKDVLRMIRGAPGTTVTLELSDPARNKTNQFTVRRGTAIIENGSVVRITDPPDETKK